MRDKEELIAELYAARDRSPDGQVNCTTARYLVEKYSVESGKMARICDELDIKLCGCELGCFK